MWRDNPVDSIKLELVCLDLIWIYCEISHPIWGLIRLSTLGGRWSIFMARLAPPHLVTIIHKRTGQIRDQAEGRYVLLEVFFNVRAWGWHVLRTPKDPTRTMWWCTDVYKNYIQIYVSFPDASLMSERCEPELFQFLVVALAGMPNLYQVWLA